MHLFYFNYINFIIAILLYCCIVVYQVFTYLFYDNYINLDITILLYYIILLYYTTLLSCYNAIPLY